MTRQRSHSCATANLNAGNNNDINLPSSNTFASARSATSTTVVPTPSFSSTSLPGATQPYDGSARQSKTTAPMSNTFIPTRPTSTTTPIFRPSSRHYRQWKKAPVVILTMTPHQSVKSSSNGALTINYRSSN